MVFEIYTKRYTYLGKGAIVRGEASHYNIFSKFVYLLVYISNTMISVVLHIYIYILCTTVCVCSMCVFVACVTLKYAFTVCACMCACEHVCVHAYWLEHWPSN